MLDSFESQFVSGKIPYSIEAKFRSIRKHHDFVYFYDKDFIIGHHNNLYRFDNKRLHLSTKDKEFIPVEWSISVLNPLTNEYEPLNLDKSVYHDQNRKMEINHYTHSFQEYLKVDYEDYKYWLWFDLESYIQDKYSNEITLTYDGYSWLYLTAYGTSKQLKMIKEWRDNVDINFSNPKASGYVIGFDSAQEFYSFTRELIQELNTVNFGRKYSDLYDSVVSGTVSKEEFLKEIIK